ncbi:oligosaccharide flippase family protein [Candidatus Woesebacteria bacterium]|nr:MAG: oligosaccharide flippase family protein [Candidatus Woesebacteria bacterium]
MSKTENEPGESFDNTLEITLETVKERAVKGIIVLTGRTFLLQIMALIASIFLGIFLSPAEFGVFFVVSAVVNFLAYFSDVGLAAALIQTKKEVTDADLKTTFTVQQFIVITLLVVLFVFVPYFEAYYNLSHEGVLLFYALGISLLMSSLKTIPSVLLERELNFSRLVLPQVLETVVYHLVAVYFAWKGYGISAFTYAVLLRGIVGLIAMYLLKPWLPGLKFSKYSLKKLLKFGVPYQANTFLATIKDDGLTAFLGGILTPAGLGYLGWAQKWAKYPLRLFMDNVLKVTFPAFSRMQDSRDHLSNSVTRSIFFLCFLVFPSLAGFMILAPTLTEIIPRYEKWLPALVPLYIIGIDTVFATVTTQLTNTLNAIGKITVTFRLMIMWSVLAWVLIPVLALNFGYIGAAVGYALVSSSSIIAIIVTKHHINFSIKDSVFTPTLGTIVMAVILIVIRSFLPRNILSVIILSLTGMVVYMSTLRYLVGDSITGDVKKVAKNLFSKN